MIEEIDHDEEIEKLEKKIKELKAEKERLRRLRPEHRLAEALHNAQCHLAHEDQCGYHYESWENPGYSRKEYLRKAEGILRVIDIQQALLIVKYLR